MKHIADRREFLRHASAAGLGCLGGVLPAVAARAAEPGGGLRAGAASVDVTPVKFPVLVSGGFLSRSNSKVNDRLFARCLVLDDGATRLALMVVDTIVVPNPIQEAVRAGVSKSAGIPPENMMISATHTHSGGALHGALGTKTDADYAVFIPGKLIECIEKAAANLQPAKIGWGGEDHPEGTFCRVFIRRPDCIGADPLGRRNVRAMMSHGTSGDQQWQDYANPAKPTSRIQYATGVAEAALRAYERIEFHTSAPLAVAQREIPVKLQQPDQEAQAWADKIYAELAGRDPQTRPEVYAREIVQLRDMAQVKAKLQVIRIGELGIAAMPPEVYAITGLKLKLQCPLADMFTIELANGRVGYIPPPELRPLGGYNTWPARHTVTQDDIETIMAESLLQMFEEVTGRPRRKIVLSQGPLAQKVLQRKPVAYWRLGEIEGTQAFDSSGNDNHGAYETGYAFYLDGPDRDDLRAAGEKPRAVQFAGGCMKARFDPGADYAVELFFWNGLPNDNRAVYLNEAAEPIIAGKAAVTRPAGCHDIFVGDRCDRFASFEGRMAEVAVFRGCFDS